MRVLDNIADGTDPDYENLQPQFEEEDEQEDKQVPARNSEMAVDDEV